MNEGLIPRRYAKALLKYATERGCSEQVYKLMKSLSAAFATEPALDKAMTNPFVAQADKLKLLMTAAGATDSDTAFVDFIKLLEQNKRIGMIRLSAIAYEDLYREANNIYRVTVTSAAPMEADAEARLKKLIADHLNGAKMEYASVVDPDLIGGFTVGIDSERLDASIKNELKQLRLKLLSK